MKFSIVTINYNNKIGLQRTIDSVVNQTFSDLEWIIIDGGSTDGSKELIEKYASFLSYWCSEEDRGIYNAQNKGIKRATGEYLLFLNSGDFLANDEVLKDVNGLGENADFILGNIIVREDDGTYLWDIKEEMLSARQFFWGTLPHSGTFIKREMFNKFGLYDEEMKICSDWKFFVEAILFGQSSIKKIPLTISVFEGGGVSDTMLDIRYKERQKVLNKIFPPMIQQDYKMVESLLELKRIWLFDKLYSILYRMSVLYQKVFCRSNLGYNFKRYR